MCEGWWTEARNADQKSGIQARGTKQRELVEEISLSSRGSNQDQWCDTFGQQ